MKLKEIILMIALTLAFQVMGQRNSKGLANKQNPKQDTSIQRKTFRPGFNPGGR
jgi:hypothetical protein